MPLTARQKAHRQAGVGASEVLAALGKDPRCSPLALYGRKVGEVAAPQLEDDERVLFGQLLEPVIRKEVERRMGVKVIQRHQTLYHPEVPLLGHVDGWMPALRSGLEIKTADRFEADEFGEEGSDQVPPRYFIQCAAYIAITDAEEWHLAVLIGGNTLKRYRIPRDPSIEDMILQGVADFWRHVERMIPPDPTTPEDVRLRWPRDFGGTIVANPAIEHTALRLREMRADMSQLAAQCESDTVDIQKFMEANSELVSERGEVLATWRTARPSSRLDTKRFAADYPALYAECLREVPGSRRFLLKGDRDGR
jgi:putative phage-type endonuclease